MPIVTGYDVEIAFTYYARQPYGLLNTMSFSFFSFLAFYCDAEITKRSERRVCRSVYSSSIIIIVVSIIVLLVVVNRQ